MLTPDQRDGLTGQVDARAKVLIEELREHQRTVADFAAQQGKPPPDQRMVFEGWVIQKIAGLQVLAFECAEDREKRS